MSAEKITLWSRAEDGVSQCLTRLHEPAKVEAGKIVRGNPAKACETLDDAEAEAERVAAFYSSGIAIFYEWPGKVYGAAHLLTKKAGEITHRRGKRCAPLAA